MKQVILVRKDLRWGKGKLASHCAHASVGAVRRSKKEAVKKWEKEGAKKIVLKVSSLKKLKEIHKKVKKAKIPSFLVKDAGLTQLKKGTITCLGIGPSEDKKIDRITGKLKLL
jgi:PTH2 family peptidyl-tRNA hydrolase